MGSDYGRKVAGQDIAEAADARLKAPEASRADEERYQRQQAVQLAISAGRSDPSEIINTARMIHKFIMGEQPQ